MSALDIALLLLRVVAGLTLAAHGAQKLFGWFGGPGLKRFLHGFAAQGLRPAWLWVAFALLGELGGGLSLTFGFLTPLGAAGAFGAMLMAASTHWKKGFFNGKGGLEYPLLLMVVALALGVAGPGGLAIDALLGVARIEVPLFAALALGALVVVIVGNLIRRPPAPATVQPATIQPTEATVRVS
ncbi:MAG: DoxX family protein [Chloroflexota bacterium]|nr:DoxX family protein [Chloroflexota bacterium]